MRLYLSGPMSGIADSNFPAFNKAAGLLRQAGYDVENPASKGLIDGWEWEDYLRYDLRQLLDCDGVAVLPGYIGSRGASLEVHVADELSVPVFTVETWIEMTLDTDAEGV
jgi:hypothetical protein